MNGINESLFLLINANTTSPVWVLGFASFVSEYLLYTVPLFLIYIWLWGERREPAVRALFVALVALGLAQVIGMVYPHPRPFMVPIGHTFITHIPDASFPSDHATLFFSVSLALVLGREWIFGLSIFLVGLLVAWSRIYLGVHFPFDMVGALIVATAGCLIVWSTWHDFGVKLMGLAETLYRYVFSFPISKKWVRH